jgi:hypothetical protein
MSGFLLRCMSPVLALLSHSGSDRMSAFGESRRAMTAGKAIYRGSPGVLETAPP